MIECIFGWGKQHGTMRKAKHRGAARVATGYLLNLIACNLIRIPKLLATRPTSNGTKSPMSGRATLLNLCTEIDRKPATPQTSRFFSKLHLSDLGDQLAALLVAVDFAIFRPELAAALAYSDGSQAGRPPFDPVMMFKILVIQSANNLSDERTEFFNDRLSFMLKFQASFPTKKWLRFIWLRFGLTNGWELC